MKYLFTLCLLIVSLSGIAQWQQTGARVRYVNGLGIPTRDTAAGVAADSSQILIRPADSSLYIKYKRTWVKVGSGGTIGGSGTTNYVPKFTGSTTLGNSQIFDDGTFVLLGTTSTSGVDKVRINNDGASLYSSLNITNANSTANMFVGVGGSTVANTPLRNNAYIMNKSASGVAFGTNDITRMFITSAGDVGINQNAPAGRFVVTDGQTLLGTNTNNGVDRLQVSGITLSTRYKVNTSGQTIQINNFYNGGNGNNIWIGGGGASSTSQAEGNVSLGVDALLSNTSGYYNTAIGGYSLRTNTSGYVNDAFGFNTLYSNTSGYRNVAFGASSLYGNTTGYENMGIGHLSLAANTTGFGNVAVGAISMANNTTGSSNIAFGRNAGTFISGGGNLTTPSQSIFIGEDTRPSANGNSNEVVIGHTNIGQGSNTVTLGNSSITRTFLRGSVMVNTTTDNGVDKLQVSGSIQGTGFDQAYLARTTAYTATDTDYLIDCTTGTFTVTLPASSGRTGRILIIKNSGTGTITVDGNASETIDGATTYSLSTQYATVQIMSDGTNWKIIAKF